MKYYELHAVESNRANAVLVARLRCEVPADDAARAALRVEAESRNQTLTDGVLVDGFFGAAIIERNVYKKNMDYKWL